jgi:uncharacterized protein (DUF2236 family)
VDEVTGRRYEASDPALLLWVHAALVESTVSVRRLLGTPLAAQDADRYVAEMVVAAELVGIPAGTIPASMAQLDAYIESVRPELRCTPAAAESMAYLLDPPGLDEEIADIWQDVRYGAVASLPEWAREMYGYTAEPLTPARREEVRQVLGVLDAVFIGEPGVLEARQRITALMRATERPA